MIKVTCFESVFSESDVRLHFFRGFVCHGSLVNDGLCLTFALEWKGIFRAAVILFLCGRAFVGFVVQNGFVVQMDNTFDIRQTTIT